MNYFNFIYLTYFFLFFNISKNNFIISSIRILKKLQFL